MRNRNNNTKGEREDKEEGKRSMQKEWTRVREAEIRKSKRGREDKEEKGGMQELRARE